MKKWLTLCLGLAVSLVAAESAFAGTIKVFAVEGTSPMGYVRPVEGAVVSATLLPANHGPVSELCKGTIQALAPTDKNGEAILPYPELDASCSALVVASKGEEVGNAGVNSLGSTDEVTVHMHYALMKPLLPFNGNH